MTSAANPAPANPARPNDPLGAFCQENHVALDGAPDGPLAGLTFAVKDVFHIAGHRTGFGHPDWLRTHPPAESTALVVRQLLDAGARMVGKTLTDELTYSLSGQNVHYGTPVNHAAPDRIPGGSSNGSVSAVAGGLADFALGTDCGGSVRLPASYCGVLGIRPTHGRVPVDGVLPFGPSFDAVGWFARDASVFRAVGDVLLDEDAAAAVPGRLLYAADAFGLVEPRVAECLEPAVVAAGAAVGPAAVGNLEQVTVSPEGLDQWYETFRVIQAYEIWGNLGLWIGETRPEIGPGIRERLEFASRVEPWMVASANEVRKSVRARMDDLLAGGDVLCLPTSPRVAPLKDAPSDDLEVRFRQQAMNLLCIAGLAGLPQVSLPLATLDGLPLGLSLVGRRGADRRLLALAEALMPEA
jgi:amidase